MDRAVRERKPTNHYDPSKEAAKPQWGSTSVVASLPAEYWGNDANTVFVEALTTASRVSLRWEQEQLENTVRISATGVGTHTVFADE
jgi:hypothetical protein